MTTTKQDIVIPQGGNFLLVLDVVGGPENLTGFNARMQVRERKGGVEVLADLQSEISVVPENRQVILNIPSDVTATYEWNLGVYDMLLIGPGDSWRLVEGRVRVSESVTKED